MITNLNFNLQLRLIKKNYVTSKYTVFVFLYAVLAPKIYKKVVWKKTVPGPKNVQFRFVNMQKL